MSNRHARAGRGRPDDAQACGNSVRNITACQFAGVGANEPFDVTPYAEALTRFLLRHPLSSSLPRTFKIAFEGCAHDHIKLTINDIGWLAQVRDGRRGFRVHAGGGLPDADTIADVTSCPGAESCKLAVTQSRGLGQALEQHLRATPGLIDLAPDLDLKISGCPNGCGQHHIATIGFLGSLRKVAGRAVPQYFIQVGGGIDARGTSFGRLAAKVPARRVPEALERLVRLYARERAAGESAVTFFRRLDVPTVKALLADLEALAADGASDHDFIDLAETTAFRPSTSEGECAV